MKKIHFILSVFLIAHLSSCAKIQKRENLVQSTNTILTAGIGEVVYKRGWHRLAKKVDQFFVL